MCLLNSFGYFELKHDHVSLTSQAAAAAAEEERKKEEEAEAAKKEKTTKGKKKQEKTNASKKDKQGVESVKSGFVKTTGAPKAVPKPKQRVNREDLPVGLGSA